SSLAVLVGQIRPSSLGPPPSAVNKACGLAYRAWLSKRCGTVPSTPRREEHYDQVGHARILSELFDKRRDLAPMMGLMVEEVGDGPPQRMLVLPPVPCDIF